jgi:hypothetical protein
MTAMRRGPVVIGRREAARARSVHSGRGKIAATNVHTRRAVTGRAVIAAIAGATPAIAGATLTVAVVHVLLGASKTRNSVTGNSATRNLMRRERVVRKGHTRRAVKASATIAIGPEATDRSTQGREMATARKENSAVKRSFRASVAHARISEAVRIAVMNSAGIAAM